MLAHTEWIPPEPPRSDNTDCAFFNRILCRLTIGSAALLLSLGTVCALVI